MDINAQGFTTAGVFTPDKLFDQETVQRKATLAGGNGVVKRGTVLGKITATGLFVMSAAAAGDGSEAVDRVLLEDVDTTGGDAEGMTAIAGEFNGGGLILGVGHTLASIDDALRLKDIFIFNAAG